jgi:glutathione synthase/RimK-type ligase-like ATP-grasp enzyme
MRPRIALATYANAPSLAPDDQLLLPALAAAGMDGEPAVWSDDDVIWETFDVVIMRSCWDYHLRHPEFRAWLERLDASRLPVWNSVSLVDWNAHKSYLIDLSSHGVPIVPTRVLDGATVEEIEALVQEEGWQRFVLKPAISASGYETHALDARLDAPARAIIRQVAAAGDVLVQPFVEEVPRDGEYSLMFIDGAYSHSAIKRAAGAEFRVQTEHGGSVTAIEVDPWLIEAASRVLNALPEVPLYARVDGIMRGEEFLLMELELIEPNLFLELRPGSADRLAEALRNRLS